MRLDYVIQKNSDGTISNPYLVKDGENEYYITWRQLCAPQIEPLIDSNYVQRLQTTIIGDLMSDIRVSVELKAPEWEEYLWFINAGGLILPALYGPCANQAI